MTEPNLQFRAVFCENLGFAGESAVFCSFLRPPNAFEFPGEGANLRKSALFAEVCVFWALSISLPLSLSPSVTSVPSP